MGTQSTLFGPVKYSIIPELVEEEQLIQEMPMWSWEHFWPFWWEPLRVGWWSLLSRVSLSFSRATGFCRFGFSDEYEAANGGGRQSRFETGVQSHSDHTYHVGVVERKMLVLTRSLPSHGFGLLAGILSLLPVYCKIFCM